MIRFFLMGFGLLLLASCGADGLPTPPSAKNGAQNGVSIGGTVSVGVTGS